MGKETLSIRLRTTPNKHENKRLRREGYLLGCISVTRDESIAFAVRMDQFKMALKRADGSNLFTFVLDNNTSYEVRLKEVQMFHVKLEIAHINFQLISCKEEVEELEMAI